MSHANALPRRILAIAGTLPEGQPLTAKGLLHLGSRAAVDQALARLARQGQLLRIARGVYVSPIESRFGRRPPAVEKVVEAFGQAFGETVAAHGATAANRLGLSTQVPVREVYLTSGPSRRLTLGRQEVELRHAQPRELVAPNTLAGEAVRAMLWLGRSQGERAARTIAKILSREERTRLTLLQHSMPSWMAQSVGQALAHG